MKKMFLIVIAAAAATLTLSAFASAPDNYSSQGEVSFESLAMPALNCTVSMEHAQSIYRLIPSNITDICEKEYATVQKKCNSRSHFTHEGVDVQIVENGEYVTIVFSVSGYKVTARNVTWSELDAMFTGSNARG